MNVPSIGRTVIIGDSYSTFEGHIPKGNDFWYSKSVHKDNGVLDVGLTWWYKLFDKVDGTLVLNESWSGAPICHTGYNSQDASFKSYVTRVDKLICDGFFEREKIDTVLVFGGTNDSWAGSPLGEENSTDLYCVRPAITYLARRLSLVSPTPRVIFIINPIIKQEITETFYSVCKQFDAEALLLSPPDINEGHPTALGMADICRDVYNYLANIQ